MDDGTPPPAPTGLVATPGNARVTLSWNKVTDNVSLVGFRIYDGSTLLTFVTGLSTIRTGLPNGVAKTAYGITAVDSSGNESAKVLFPSFTPTAPTQDEILPTAGALILIDPASLYGAWPAGVPGHGTKVTNLARTQAFAAAGTGVVGDYDFTVNNTLTATDGVLERTPKGALHGIISQSTAAGGRKFDLEGGAIRAYLLANPNNDYFISLWAVPTRLSIETTPGTLARFAGFLSSASGDTITARLASGNKMTVAPSANRILVKESATPAVVDAPINIQGAHSLVPAMHASDNAFIHFGYKDATASALNKQASWALLRVYLEDLTASGRTAAEVAAIDNELFDRDVLTVGGRYNGDTHTSVSALP